eukprot:TRINITY_DN3107_c0_g1_i2.p1 TRINITY_DN3107_c0_g1~~TRINITY_DN3107_c0_g1_i2.p1  ORF type:complete len:308 (-),score=42.89 TRINITY_DN3107_c0_g1_i2:2-814(-)
MTVTVSYNNVNILRSVCKKWNDFLQNDVFWRTVCFQQWPSLIHLSLSSKEDKSFFKKMFQKRYKYTNRLAEDLNKANVMFQADPDYLNLINQTKAIEMASQVKGYRRKFAKNKGETTIKDFYIDSLAFTKIETRQVVRYAGCNNGYAVHDVNLVEGTIMTFAGEDVSFKVKCDWFTAGGHSDGDLWGEENIFTIGDHTLPIEHQFILHEGHPELTNWYQNVKELLVWRDASDEDLLMFFRDAILPDIVSKQILPRFLPPPHMLNTHLIFN